MNSLYYRDTTVELHVGDAIDVMQSFPDSSVNCVVTSPPHWGLRDYGTTSWTGGNPHCHHTLGTTPHQRRSSTYRTSLEPSSSATRHCRNCGATGRDQQYGLEASIRDHVDRIQHISTEVGRLLTPRGTLWLNLRDSFSYQNDGTGRTRTNTTQAASEHVAHKSLMGIPWRVALALQRDGWIVRNAIVWHKPNAIPDPTWQRFSARYEMVFLLVKQPDYYFNPAQAREPLTHTRTAHRKHRHGGVKPHTIHTPSQPNTTGKNAGDIWSISTRPLPEAHCAPFPVDLPRRCIAAGCPDNGRVLDPFSGAGTTGLAAHQLGRFYQGIDLRGDYHDIFLRRITVNTDHSAA